MIRFLADDPDWADWSIHALDAGAIGGPLLINDVIYAELSVRFAAIETLDAFIAEAGLIHELMPRAALFLAGKAFQRYRWGGGTRTGVLADFFVGAHAAIAGLTLITRDARRYRSYFRSLRLVAP